MAVNTEGPPDEPVMKIPLEILNILPLLENDSASE